MLDAANMSPTFPTAHSAFSNTQKAKTWAPSSSDNYEVPIDANVIHTTATLPAGNYGDNYETPLDASI